MKPGDRVRWSEAHCRLEALKAKPYQAEAVYDELRRHVGHVIDSRAIGNVATVTLKWAVPFGVQWASDKWALLPDVHTLPAELLEVAP